ncbi:MAG TPA: putative peptidoglycan glycosyltransferase FtsW [Verrucomicrobiales bacterium]|jgi:cell division protein FtsW|nr:putative peptidoglycan glycosyltransferase FtsW [Verrucomicrobiales bacterium]
MARRSAFCLIACVALLTALGFIMLMSTGGFSQESAHDEWAGLKRQAVWLGAGLAACAVMAMLDYHRLQRLAWPIFWVCVVLLALCFVPGIAHARGGASRWINIAGARGQPSEIARIGIIIALAAWCARYRDRRASFLWGFTMPLAVVALPIGLIAAEVDLGTACLLFIVCCAVLFIGGARWIYIAVMVAAGAGVLFMGLKTGDSKTAKNRWARITAFLHLDDESFAKAYPEIEELNNQQKQGIYALGSGGPSGVGLGDGRQKQHYLPLCHTDFVFPVIGEELGLAATLGTVLLVLGVAFSGFLVAAHAPDRFGKLLGTGLVLLIVVQAMINIGVTTGCLPNKGMPLPFVSYGGSNLCCCLISVGILLNIYRQGRPVILERDPVLGQPKLTPAV